MSFSSSLPFLFAPKVNGIVGFQIQHQHPGFTAIIMVFTALFTKQGHNLLLFFCEYLQERKMYVQLY